MQFKVELVSCLVNVSTLTINALTFAFDFCIHNYSSEVYDTVAVQTLAPSAKII